MSIETFLIRHRKQLGDIQYSMREGTKIVVGASNFWDRYVHQRYSYVTTNYRNAHVYLYVVVLGEPWRIPPHPGGHFPSGENWCEVGKTAAARVALHLDIASYLDIPTTEYDTISWKLEIATIKPTFFVFRDHPYPTDANVVIASNRHRIFQKVRRFEADLLQLHGDFPLALIHGHILVGTEYAFQSVIDLVRFMRPTKPANQLTR